jgi:hypothetical protein
MPPAQPTPTQTTVNTQDFLFEFIPNGAYLKVSALDPKTGTEVSIVGALAARQSDLILLASRKLITALNAASAAKLATQQAPAPAALPKKQRGGLEV